MPKNLIKKIAQPGKIIGPNIILRKLKISDAKDIMEWIKEPEISKWTLVQIKQNSTLQEEIKFIKTTHLKARKRKVYTFGIILKNPKTKVIGSISIQTINWKNKNAQIGYILSKEHWGKGLIPEAVNILLHFAFKKIGLHKIYGAIFEPNTKSQRVLEKCEFTKEGISREVYFRYNKWQNLIKYGILTKEFKSSIKPIYK